MPELALLCRGEYVYSHRKVFMHFFVLFLNSEKGFQAEIVDGLIKIMNCGVILI